MKTKQRMALFIALIMVFSIAGLGVSTDVADAAKKKPKRITLKTTSKYVDIKGKVTVSVKSVSPSKASKAVTWKTSNKKIATVSKKGVVTGKKKGKVNITATSKVNKKVKKTIKITVKQMKPKVSLPSKATMYSGVKKSLKAKVGPKGVYNKGITYTSSNKSIATVSKTGVVTPKKGGKVTITAKSKENKKYRDKCVVTVRQSVTGISFGTAKVAMSTKDYYTNPTIKFSPAPAPIYSNAVTYSSSNTRVATVNNSGKVYAVAPGTAKITARSTYGLKRSGSYTVSITDRKITPTVSVGGVIIPLSKDYNSFKFSAVRDGKPVNIILSKKDIENAFSANGSLGFYWRDARTVYSGFPGSTFSFASGSDYLFSKSGDKVTIKIPGYPSFNPGATTAWYIVNAKNSINVVDPTNAESNYRITLYEKAVADDSAYNGLSISLNRVGNTLTTVPLEGKKLTIVANNDSTVTATVTIGVGTANEKSMSAVLVKTADGGYTMTINKGKYDEYSASVVAYK